MSEPYWEPLAAAPTRGIIPSARIYRAAAWTVVTNTWTAIPFDTKRWDSDTIWAAGSPTRLTCKTAGKYLIVASVGFGANSAGVRYLRTWLNGTTNIAIADQPANTGDATHLLIASVWDLAVNDYLEAHVYQSSAATLTMGIEPPYAPEFSMTHLGL